MGAVVDQYDSDTGGMYDSAVQGLIVTNQELLVKLNRGIVGRAMWVSVLDRKTCPRCGALHGKIWRVDQVSSAADRIFDFPTPPLHQRCRCTLAFARTGEPLPKIESFDAWLRKQPFEVAEDVLGKAKAELFHKGEISLNHFVEGTERAYTLKEMRRKEKEKFNDAWLSKQDMETIERIIGKTKARLFVEGFFPLRDLLNFAEAQLRRRDPKAFDAIAD